MVTLLSGEPATENRSALELDIALGGLQHVGRHLLAFLDHLFRREVYRDAADGQAPRTVGVAAVGSHGGIPVEDLHIVHVHPEGVGGDLGPGGDVSLAVGRGAGNDLHLARGAHPHGRRLPAAALQADAGRDLRGREAAALGEVADADAELLDVSGLAAALLLGAQLVVVGEFEGPAHAGLVVAGVVHDAGRGRGRLVERRDQVLQPQLRRVHVQLAGEVVHDPLVRVGRLRATGSPVGVRRGEVGKDPCTLEGVGVEGVEARIREGAEDGDARA